MIFAFVDNASTGRARHLLYSMIKVVAEQNLQPPIFLARAAH